MYFTEDTFNCHYCFFSANDIPATSDIENIALKGNYVVIGPWIETMPSNDEIYGLLQKNRIPAHLKPELMLYYEHLSVISYYQSWEALLIMIGDYLYDDEKKFNIAYIKDDQGIESVDYSPKQDDSLSLKLINKLYEDETNLLDAIQAGNTRQALICMAKLSQYRPPQRAQEKNRDSKSYLLALNTLARKAVQNSSVHPFHIHTMSNDFARQIENAERQGEFYSICETMIRCYCSLVQEYSLKNYSSVVRNVINEVEFNLKKPLSLSLLSRQFNIDPSNLSHHFTREMGMTLTDFINLKRLEKSCYLLLNSALYVQEIAEECGYQDVNYFIRLFKRKYGKTPGEYRNHALGK